MKALFIITLFVVSACSQPLAIKQAAIRAGFLSSIVETTHFDLLVKTKITMPGKQVVIYIEGDGQAWLSKKRISPDPTPINPLALKLALLDHRENVAYIARPCQYIRENGKGRNCDNRYWTSHRFSEEVIQAVSEAVNHIAKRSSATSIELVGYSGGGAVAALLASRRAEVSLLRTVAGNLDHTAVNKYHGVSPLSGSLNPAHVATKLKDLCQIHYSGTQDEIIPVHIAEKFIGTQGTARNAIHIVIEKASHTKGWETIWPSLLATQVECNN